VFTRIAEPGGGSAPEFVPVILGGHVGAYSLARAFHEGYGVRSLVVTGGDTWVTDHSTIMEKVHCPDLLDEDTLVRTLTGAPFTDITVPMLLLATSDTLVEKVVAVADRVGPGFRVPYVGVEVLERATRKHTFDEVAQKAGVSTPATAIIDLGGDDWHGVQAPGPFPLILKATAPTAWHGVSFEGQAKVHEVASEAELQELVARIHAAGYRDKLVLQDRIPGDDTGMRILTCYCDRDSNVRFASWGQTLIEEHSPGQLGVPAAILTGVNSEVVAQATRLLAELRWVGYANFDLKYDPRDGSVKFFELNPRLGRSNYYVTGTGHNAVSYYVDEYIRDTLGPVGPVLESTAETIYSVVPVRTIKWALQGHPELWEKVHEVIQAGGLRNPLHYRAEKDPRRWVKVALGGLSYDRKFHRYYDPLGEIGSGT